MLLNTQTAHADFGVSTRQIGFWRSVPHTYTNPDNVNMGLPACLGGVADTLHLPFPEAHPEWRGDVAKEDVLRWIQTLQTEGPLVRIKDFYGGSSCRICGKGTGCEEAHGRAGALGSYVMPSGYAHYVDEHNVCPEAEELVFMQQAADAMR
jgi:hypothetical protein